MELIYCAAGNKRFAEIAQRYGMRYGAQLPATIYYPPYFVDQDWRKPDRARYMVALAQHRPALATVLDWERDDQLDEVLSWATEAAQYVTDSVIIIPKVMGGIGRIPEQINGKPVRLGYSVPTAFAGTMLPLWEFGARPVHLLGGSPHKQMELARYLNVVSTDGNYVAAQALRHGQFWTPTKTPFNGHFPRLDAYQSITDDVPYHAFELSTINLMNAWRGLTVGIRYACERDLDSLLLIAKQWKNELGYVSGAVLRGAIERQRLYVAEFNNAVVGFAHWYQRKDGTRTIYEIAVHRDWLGKRAGEALLNAVPAPRRLKCTVENTRANAFYARSGMQIARVEAGKHRPLNVWVTPDLLEAS